MILQQNLFLTTLKRKNLQTNKNKHKTIINNQIYLRMKTKQKLMIFATVFFLVAVNSDRAAAQSVAIGEREFVPHPSAILEVQSTTKGILIPRVTFTQRMHIQTNAQAAGLLVFQTDREVGFYYFDGLLWRFLDPDVNTELPNLACVAFTGSWNDLLDRPNIANLPSLHTVATSGSWNDLEDRPTIAIHLRDLQQDNVFYMTVTREEKERWNTSAARTVPTHLRDLQQDDIFYMTITREQMQRWDNTAATNFSGRYEDLIGIPNFASIALSGRWVDLQDRPNFHTVATSGDFRDLQNVPDFHHSALSGSWNDLQDRPNFHNIAFSGSYNDLTNVPVWGDWDEISELQIGTARTGNHRGGINHFARIDHTHTIANSVPTQSVGTSNNTIVSTEMLHTALRSHFGNTNPTQSNSGDVISGGYDVGSQRYMLNIRPNVILTGVPRLESPPNRPINNNNDDRVAVMGNIREEIEILRTELLAQVRAEIAAERSIVPIGAVVMVAGAADRNRFNSNCWVEVTEMRGRFPIGAGHPQNAGTNEFRDNVTTGSARIVNVGQSTDGAGAHGVSFRRLTPAQIPDHTHSSWTGNIQSGGTGHRGRAFVINSPPNNSLDPNIQNMGRGTAPGSRAAGPGANEDGQAIDNRPPFYGVYFMRKIAYGC